MSGEPQRRPRPKPFAEDWSLPGTPRPPTTVANPLGALARADRASLRPRSVGERFRRYSVEELVATPNVDFFWGGVDLSPDGSEVAFSWDRSGAYEIYSAPLVGDRIIQLTGAGARSVAPQWSPDGRWVAFLRDVEGAEKMQIWIVDRDGARERRLTEDDATHRELVWSPDGTKIAYVADPHGRAFAIYAMDVASGEHRRLTEGSEDDARPKWSPDGRWILFSSHRDRVSTNADLFIVPAAGGEALRLETREGVDGESIQEEWSPDGSVIAFTTNVRGRSEIAYAHLRDGVVARIERVGATPYDDTDPTWRPDGRAVLYRHAVNSEVSIRRVFTVSRADEAVMDMPGVHFSPRVGPDGETAVAIFSGARRPADVVVRPNGSPATRRITDSLPSGIDPETLVEPVHVSYPGANGLDIPALLYLPLTEALDGSVPPGVLYVHGGPTAQHFRRWDAVSQLLANHGYVVLAPNIRGSTGYGRAFQEGNRRDWGGKDLEDVLKGAEWLEREGLADGRRLGVRGASYGGYMTLMCMALAPGRWAAGVSIVGVVSWKTMYSSTRGDLQRYLLRELGDPEGDEALYRERSPSTHAAKIEAPLLVLQGAKDVRVPLAEADQLVEALRASGRTFEYHVYEHEGHAIGSATLARREDRIDVQRRAFDWFEKHLKPRRS